MESNFSNRELILDTVNKLFVFTDKQLWGKLQEEVFTENIYFDMTSAGGLKPETISSAQICKIWEDGFKNLDAVHHQAGNYLVEIEGDSATVFANAIASHYKVSALNGKTREFIGSYDLRLEKTRNGWRISSFVYHLKYMTGNIDLD
ncbi:MAG: nuclear transport factor 2 family protein [Bacteroidales bacterium]|nr:nuclear transport factor 2 family protein [Bacteroidales bacterium]